MRTVLLMITTHAHVEALVQADRDVGDILLHHGRRAPAVRSHQALHVLSMNAGGGFGSGLVLEAWLLSLSVRPQLPNVIFGVRI